MNNIWKDKYIIIIGNEIKWRINEKDSKLIQFGSDKGIALVNPLYYNSKFSSIDSNFVRVVKINNNYLIDSKILIFRKYVDSIDYEVFIDFLAKFLRYIRVESKQANINPNNFILSFFQVNKINLQIKENIIIEDSNQIMIRELYYNTMVQWAMVKSASLKLKKEIEPPIYLEIFVDALSGLMNSDSRKVILYSTIAIESMLAIELDRKYETICNNNLKRKHRVRKIKTTNGFIYKDPIYEAISERTSFAMLLHERPLYLLNKSILIDNEVLYKDAKKLYLTRNKIVHLGEPSKNTKDSLSIDMNGAIEAFTIAVEIFKWMNIKTFDSFDFYKFVEVNKS